MEDEIINQVIDLRIRQKLYFSSRGGRVLNDCKKAEVKLDKMLDEYKAIKETQKGG